MNYLHQQVAANLEAYDKERKINNPNYPPELHEEEPVSSQLFQQDTVIRSHDCQVHCAN
jgi:hypothetical protein